MKKRILSILLTGCMVLSMLPMTRGIAHAAVNDTNSIGVNVNTATAAEIVFGGTNWRVIGYNGTGVATETGSMTLLPKYFFGNNISFDNIRTPKTNEYSGSRLQMEIDKLAAVKSGSNGGLFTEAEFAAIKPVNLVGGASVDAVDGMHGPDVNGAKLWPLSVSEASGTAIDLRKVPNYNWWLRSPNILIPASGESTVSFVRKNTGDLGIISLNSGTACVRPALKLKLDSVLFTSNAINGKVGIARDTLSATASTLSGLQKLTILDGGLTLSSATVDTLTANTRVTLSYEGYANNTTQGTKALSAIVTEKSTGALKYYGTLATDPSESGTANLIIPKEFDSNTMELKVFAETINGDSLTDYASTPVKVTGLSPAISKSGTVTMKGITYEVNTADPTTINYAGKEWRVIGADGKTGVATTSGSMTLLSRNALGTTPFDRTRNEAYGINEYSGSDLQKEMDKLVEVKSGSNSGIFTQAEQAAIKQRTLEVGEFSAEEPYCDGVATTAVLGARLWPLSQAEATTLNSALYRSNDGKEWWLRSPGQSDDYVAYGLGIMGDVYSGNNGGFISGEQYSVRPAFQLNLDSVLMASNAIGGKSGTAGTALSPAAPLTGAQKLTILDSGHVLSRATTKDSLTAGNTITVNYAGATTGSGVDLAAMITDSTGVVSYYGTLIADLSSESGTAQVTLPSDFNSSSMSLKLFIETINGDNLTDYASNPVAVAVVSSNSYDVTASPATNGSYIVKAGDHEVASAESGEIITVNPTADSNYELNTVTIKKTSDSTDVTNTVGWDSAAKTFTMPAYAVTINVTFKAKIPSYKPVTNITGVPSQATAGTDLILGGTVVPKDATNQIIQWSVTSQGTTGATIDGGNKLKTTDAGTVTVTARVANGIDASTDYVKEFTITVIATTGALSGQVVDENNNPVSGAAVTLLPSNPLLTTTTDTNGDYSFSNVQNGNHYNIVVEKDGITLTDSITMNATSITKNMKLLGGEKNTVVENKPGTLPVSVSGMNGLLDADNFEKNLTLPEQAAVSDGGSVRIKLIAEKKAGTEVTSDKDKMEILASNHQLGLFIDLSMFKTVKESSGTAITADEKLTTLSRIIEIKLPIPAELQDKAGLSVFRVHNDTAQTLPQELANANADGEYFSISADGTYITLYVKNFSTYAIGYTAYDVNISGIGTGGSGAGKYMPNDTVTLNAGTKSGYNFSGWTVNSGGVTLTNASSASTTFIMPATTVSLTANWTNNGDNGGSGNNGGSGGNGGSGNGGSGGSSSGGSGVAGSSAGNNSSTTTTTGTVSSFGDVNSNDWFYDSVLNATKKGWFKGTSEGTFSPYLDTTRGMIVTILQRIEKGTSVNGSLFNDVISDAYYANAVAWANENKIVEGYDNGNFGPDDSITREQLASILYRYASWKGYDVSKAAALDSFADADSTSEYAKKAMGWAVANGLINGMDNGTLAPMDKANRAQVAAILTRFDKLFSKI